jgi:hypothetical protein
VAQGCCRYRCFLPDLTGFTVPPCTGPNYQQSTSLKPVRLNRRRASSSRALPAIYGGEGGIRTPGTLIRGTHDFQSCTFNRSVTSPSWDFKHLRALPYSGERSMSQKCRHRAPDDFFERITMFTGSKDECPIKKISQRLHDCESCDTEKNLRIQILERQFPGCLHT